ncbi:MAG TPA: choice-of-anchor tandem repeat GloVer-containing protein [Chthonomonadaceae bacterium]|nr:choice-of-anchor tandem repeat GloVer-containing protein [Chthonomonadaceae bacterium]
MTMTLMHRKITAWKAAGWIALLAGAVLPARASTTITTLYQMNSGDGYQSSALVQAPDGNFYGTAQGGANFEGMIFCVSPSGQYSTIYTFNGTAEGAQPSSSLIVASDGNLYGTALQYGAFNAGTVYQVTLTGSLSVLHAFNNATDGEQPYGVTQASDGYLYGVASVGGPGGYGTIYRLGLDGSFTILHAFTATDGATPCAPPIEGADGDLYGTTYGGGAYGYGTVYKISKSGAFTLLHSFAGGQYGIQPEVRLVQASDGNFYGTTKSGGSTANDGTIFRISPSGAFATIHVMGFADGSDPDVPLLQAADGDLYGGDFNGGSSGVGSGDTGEIFRITLSGKFTGLYTFFGSANGSSPSGLVQGIDGNLYGTTYGGGASSHGTVFRWPLSAAIQKLSPTTLPAGSPATPLTVSGSNFLPGAVVRWNGNALDTRWISDSALQAQIPASYLAVATTARVTVSNPTATGNVSGVKTFMVTVTSIAASVGTPYRDSATGLIVVPVTLTNSGYATASSLVITSAKLGASAASSALPIAFGNVAAGGAVSASLSFPGTAGTTGSQKTLLVSGAYTGGKFSGALKISLP